jgi:hypothetical protein
MYAFFPLIVHGLIYKDQAGTATTQHAKRNQSKQ